MPSIALLLSSGLRTAKNKSDQLLRILMCRQVSQRVVFFHEISFYLSHWQLANVLSKGIKGGHLSLAFTVAYFIALLPPQPPLSPGNKWSSDISLCQSHRKYSCQRPALTVTNKPLESWFWSGQKHCPFFNTLHQCCELSIEQQCKEAWPLLFCKCLHSSNPPQNCILR